MSSIRGTDNGGPNSSDMEKNAVSAEKVSVGFEAKDAPVESSLGEVRDAAPDVGYHRRLERRQIMMMTFGAGIGTGLWVGTGTALAYAGPAGLAIAYTIMALIVYIMFCSVGEVTAYKPVDGGFIRQCKEYVDPALAFALGMNFWFNWTVIIPAEVTAAIQVTQFWSGAGTIPTAGWITIFLVLMVAVNIFEVKLYGELEYWMSLLKCVAIVGMIAFLLVATCGGVPAHGAIGFAFWRRPGAFRNGVKGISKAFVQAGFSFGGGEHIAVIAGEARNPRKAVRSAVRPLFWRMATFFVANIWLVGMNVPADDARLVTGAGTLGSPFVIAIERAGVRPLAHVLNAFILVTVVSCGITSVYIASRSLAALADAALIPRVFARKDRGGRPYVALAVSVLLGGGLSYLNCNATGEMVYNWFSSLVGSSSFLNWAALYVIHLRFRAGLAAQGVDHRTLPFRDPFAPWSQYLGLAVVSVVLFGQGYLALFPIGARPSAKTFFSTYLGVPLFALDYVVYKLVMKTRTVRAAEMDFSEAWYFDELDREAARERAANPPAKKSLRHRITAAVIG